MPILTKLAHSTSIFYCTCLKCCFVVSITFLPPFSYHSTFPLPFFYLSPFIHLTNFLPNHSSSTLSSLFLDNTASIVSHRREGFSQDRDQEFFNLVLVVADGGEPPLSSTATLSLRVCVCQRNNRGRNSNTCQAQAFLSSAGLSTGAFMAILLCIVILLGKYMVVMVVPLIKGPLCIILL